MTNALHSLTKREIKTLRLFVIVFLIASIICTLLTAFEQYRWKLSHGYYPSAHSLPPETGFLRYELGNYKFQIPVAYAYTFYEDRGNRWMEDKPPQKVGGGVTFDVFLPDFKPYGPQVHGNEQKIKDAHLYISLASESTNPVGYSPDELIKRLSGSYQERPSSVSGFREFDGKHNKQRYYFESPLTDTYFNMICNGTLCQTRVIYQHYPGLVVFYFFNENHLSQWSQIHNAVKALIGQFIVSQFNNE